MKQSAAWSSWAPGLKQEIRLSVLLILKGFGCDDGSLRKALNRDQWIQHFRQGHRPFRRDCRACILDMGSGKPHRRRDSAGSSSWAMGVDLVQFPKTVDEITGDQTRYAMVATLLVPDFSEMEEPKSEDAPKKEPKKGGVFGDDAQNGGENPPGEDLLREEPEGCEALRDAPPKVEDSSWGEGLEEEDFPLEPEPEEREGSELSPDEGAEEIPQKELVDQEIRDMSKPLKVRHLTVVHLMESRATPDVIHGLNTVTTQFRAMGLVIDRMHSDKARELVSKPVRKWLAEKGLWQSTTGGDDAAASGHVESEVSWPLALRFSAEERKRSQLEKLGTPTLEMLPFFSRVMVKRKRWHDRGHLAPPFVPAKLLGPSPWMHHGWSVKTDDDQVLHVREAVVPSGLSESVALELQEEEKTPIELDEVGDPKKPPIKLFGKQSRPPPVEGPIVRLPDSVGHDSDGYSPSIGPADAAGGEKGDDVLGDIFDEFESPESGKNGGVFLGAWMDPGRVVMSNGKPKAVVGAGPNQKIGDGW